MFFLLLRGHVLGRLAVLLGRLEFPCIEVYKVSAVVFVATDVEMDGDGVSLAVLIDQAGIVLCEGEFDVLGVFPLVCGEDKFTFGESGCEGLDLVDLLD